MRWFDVRSDNIEQIGYDSCCSSLGVKFKGGSLYEYENVPLSVFESFSKSSSKGKFFHKAIKGRFRFKKHL